jgi:hypothetical protein
MATTGGRQIRDDTGVCHLHVNELARELGIPRLIGVTLRRFLADFILHRWI